MKINSVARKFILASMLISLSVVLTLYAKRSPQFAEGYAGTLYPVLAGEIGDITGALPFSLMEIFYPALFLFLIYLIIKAVKKVKAGQSVPTVGVGLLSTLSIMAGAFLLAFTLMAGINYHRYPFSYYSNLTVKESTVDELRELCLYLTSEANRYADGFMRDEKGVAIFSESPYDVAKRAREGFRSYEKLYPVMAMGGEYFGTPKPLFSSPLMSYTQISGVMFPFTMEANVNISGPHFLIPATMMHEISHLRGFMREDEANFIAYQSARACDDFAFKYSGTMLALIHATNALYAEDPASAIALRGRYRSELTADLKSQSEYISAHEGTVSKISDAVNDVYLKANSQIDGTKSYGRMVDLLLAERREETRGIRGQE